MSLATGDEAPPFSLTNANAAVGSKTMSFGDVAGDQGTLLVFECNHCPYVVASVDRINAMAEHCASLGIGFAGINANDPVMYENDSFEHMVKRANGGMPYPYLHDDTQAVAHAYGAKRTPEFYLFNAQRKLVYQGRMDDSPSPSRRSDDLGIGRCHYRHALRRGARRGLHGIDRMLRKVEGVNT